MRRLPLIFGLLLITALTVHALYEFLVLDDGIRYFASEPRRLLYVMLLGVGGGVVAVGIDRLSPTSKRKLKLMALGTCGAFLTVFLGLIVYHLPTVASRVTEAGLWGWAVAALLGLAAGSASVWWEFRQVWRQG